MREILFRGKRIDNGEWVYGSFRQVGGHATIQDNFGNGYGVFDFSVGQFTGLFDAEGVRIFEGDIIQNANPDADRKFVGPVRWSGLFCGFLVNETMGLYDKVELYRIVGNEHDNI